MASVKSDDAFYPAWNASEKKNTDRKKPKSKSKSTPKAKKRKRSSTKSTSSISTTSSISSKGSKKRVKYSNGDYIEPLDSTYFTEAVLGPPIGVKVPSGTLGMQCQVINMYGIGITNVLESSPLLGTLKRGDVITHCMGEDMTQCKSVDRFGKLMRKASNTDTRTFHYRPYKERPVEQNKRSSVLDASAFNTFKKEDKVSSDVEPLDSTYFAEEVLGPPICVKVPSGTIGLKCQVINMYGIGIINVLESSPLLGTLKRRDVITHCMGEDMRQCKSVQLFGKLMRKASNTDTRTFHYRPYKERPVEQNKSVLDVQLASAFNTFKKEASKQSKGEKKRKAVTKLKDVKFNYTTSSSESESDIEALPSSNISLSMGKSIKDKRGGHAKKSKKGDVDDRSICGDSIIEVAVNPGQNEQCSSKKSVPRPTKDKTKQKTTQKRQPKATTKSPTKRSQSLGTARRGKTAASGNNSDSADSFEVVNVGEISTIRTVNNSVEPKAKTKPIRVTRSRSPGDGGRIGCDIIRTSSSTRPINDGDKTQSRPKPGQSHIRTSLSARPTNVGGKTKSRSKPGRSVMKEKDPRFDSENERDFDSDGGDSFEVVNVKKTSTRDTVKNSSKQNKKIKRIEEPSSKLSGPIEITKKSAKRNPRPKGIQANRSKTFDIKISGAKSTTVRSDPEREREKSIVKSIRRVQGADIDFKESGRDFYSDRVVKTGVTSANKTNIPKPGDNSEKNTMCNVRDRQPIAIEGSVTRSIPRPSASLSADAGNANEQKTTIKQRSNQPKGQLKTDTSKSRPTSESKVSVPKRSKISLAKYVALQKDTERLKNSSLTPSGLSLSDQNADDATPEPTALDYISAGLVVDEDASQEEGSHPFPQKMPSEILPEISSMRVGELKRELESYGISTASFLEKSELAKGVEEARVDRKAPAYSESNVTTNSYSSTSSKDPSNSRGDRLKEEIEKGQRMKAGELRKELESYGISTSSFVEKSEFIYACAEARVDGKKKLSGSSNIGGGNNSFEAKASNSSIVEKEDVVSTMQRQPRTKIYKDMCKVYKVMTECWDLLRNTTTPQPDSTVHDRNLFEALFSEPDLLSQSELEDIFQSMMKISNTPPSETLKYGDMKTSLLEEYERLDNMSTISLSKILKYRQEIPSNGSDQGLLLFVEQVKTGLIKTSKKIGPIKDLIATMFDDICAENLARIANGSTRRHEERHVKSAKKEEIIGGRHITTSTLISLRQGSELPEQSVIHNRTIHQGSNRDVKKRKVNNDSKESEDDLDSAQEVTFPVPIETTDSSSSQTNNGKNDECADTLSPVLSKKDERNGLNTSLHNHSKRPAVSLKAPELKSKIIVSGGSKISSMMKALQCKSSDSPLTKKQKMAPCEPSKPTSHDSESVKQTESTSSPLTHHEEYQECSKNCIAAQDLIAPESKKISISESSKQSKPVGKVGGTESSTESSASRSLQTDKSNHRREKLEKASPRDVSSEKSNPVIPPYTALLEGKIGTGSKPLPNPHWPSAREMEARNQVARFNAAQYYQVQRMQPALTNLPMQPQTLTIAQKMSQQHISGTTQSTQATLGTFPMQSQTSASAQSMTQQQFTLPNSYASLMMVNQTMGNRLPPNFPYHNQPSYQFAGTQQLPMCVQQLSQQHTRSVPASKTHLELQGHINGAKPSPVTTKFNTIQMSNQSNRGRTVSRQSQMNMSHNTTFQSMQRNVMLTDNATLQRKESSQTNISSQPSFVGIPGTQSGITVEVASLGMDTNSNKVSVSRNQPVPIPPPEKSKSQQYKASSNRTIAPPGIYFNSSGQRQVQGNDLKSSTKSTNEPPKALPSISVQTQKSTQTDLQNGQRAIEATDHDPENKKEMKGGTSQSPKKTWVVKAKALTASTLSRNEIDQMPICFSFYVGDFKSEREAERKQTFFST